MDLYHLDVMVRDDMTSNEVVEMLQGVAKALTRLAGTSLAHGKYTTLSPAMQPLCTAAASCENAAKLWDGPSQLMVPQIQPGPRPV